MEEKKVKMNVNQGANRKLTYEELNKVASELHQNYQKLMQEYQRAMEALQRRDFEYTSFFITMLFKVMEHPDMYTRNFVEWCSENIQGALTTFSEGMKEQQAEEEKKTDETE